MKTAIQKAIEAAGGTRVALASLIGTQKQNVNQWGDCVPAKWAVRIERATAVPVEGLNPDVSWRRVRCKGWPNGKPTVDVDPD